MEAGHPVREPEPPVGFDVVVLAASCGGLRALTTVLSVLTADFPAAVAIVQHVAPRFISHLAALLDRCTGMSVRPAAPGCLLAPGVAWVAPPDRHMIVGAGGVVRLGQTARVHFTRPAADPLLESAVAAFRGRVIAVILTGTGCDGAAGVCAVKAGGGLVVVQDQATSERWGMPGAAVRDRVRRPRARPGSHRPGPARPGGDATRS
jgi:two-component system chemotaxis response regulator CheB